MSLNLVVVAADAYLILTLSTAVCVKAWRQHSRRRIFRLQGSALALRHPQTRKLKAKYRHARSSLGVARGAHCSLGSAVLFVTSPRNRETRIASSPAVRRDSQAR